MIKVEMTVREMLNIIALQGTSGDLADRIISALEVACGQNQNKTITITGGMNTDNRIHCIKAIRLNTGWGLKEAKEWTDYLVGGWKYDKWYPARTAFLPRLNSSSVIPFAATSLRISRATLITS